MIAALTSVASAIDVVRENNIWRVKKQDGTYIPCYDNVFRAIETAVKALPDTRTSKMTIRILAGWGSTYSVQDGPANLRGEGNFILDCGGASGMKFNLNGGSFIDARNAHNSEVRNLNIIGKTTKIAVFFKDSNRIRFENIKVMTPEGNIGLRPEGTWNASPERYAYDVEVAGQCYFSGMATGYHGIETMALEGFTVSSTVTTRNTGGAGILLNKTRKAHIHRLDADHASYDPLYAHNYAALRLANNCSDLVNGVSKGTISVNFLKSYYCGRGFVIVTSSTKAGVYLGNVDIVGSANYGIAFQPPADGVNKVRINSGRSINNNWDGLHIGKSFDCSFQDLRLSGNKRTGLTIAESSRNIRLTRVDVDYNAQQSVFSSASIINDNSDLTN